MIKNISCVIIVRNAESTIEKVLDALVNFEDVVLYINDSSDKTSDIAKTYKNVNLIYGEFLGFGETKNNAASFAKNDWILSLDGDEVLSYCLYQTLKSKKLNNETVYVLNFSSYYKDIKINHCGWNNQKIKRLYNKDITKFSDNFVHESVVFSGLRLEELKGDVRHYSYLSISDFIIKVDRYSTLFANENKGKKKSSPTKAVLNAGFSFFKTYILKKGIFDGYVGLIISFSHMATNFYKYMKLYELNKYNK